MTTMPLASDDTRPSLNYLGAHSRATNAFNNAAQIILAQKQCVELDLSSDERDNAVGAALSRAAALITEAEKQVAAMLELHKRQERTIEEQRVENIALKRERDVHAKVGIELLAANEQLQGDLRTKVKDEIAAQREITRLRKLNDEAIVALEQLGKLTHEAVDVVARLHNGTHQTYRDVIGFIRPLGATPVTTEARLQSAGAGA